MGFTAFYPLPVRMPLLWLTVRDGSHGSNVGLQ